MDFGQHKRFLNFCTNMAQNANHRTPATSPSGTEPWHLQRHLPRKPLRLEIITLIAVVIVVAIYVRTIKNQNPISNTPIINIPFYWTSRKYGKNVDFLAFDWAPGTFDAHHCAKATAA